MRSGQFKIGFGDAVIGSQRQAAAKAVLFAGCSDRVIVLRQRCRSRCPPGEYRLRVER